MFSHIMDTQIWKNSYSRTVKHRNLVSLVEIIVYNDRKITGYAAKC